MDMTTIEAFQLSPQQRQLWLAQTEGQRFWAQAIADIEGELSPDALQMAVERVCERHEALRTTFRMQPGLRIPFQVVGETSAPSWRMLDWTAHPPGTHDQALEALATEERHRPFDLERGPMLRLCLVRCAARQHLLVATIPALCGDTAAMEILTREIASHFAVDSPRRDGDGDGPLQYADYSAWQNDLLEAGDADAESAERYWQDAQATAGPATTLPFERAPISAAVGGWEGVSRTLDRAVSAALDTRDGDREAPLAAFFTACLHAWIWRVTGLPDVGTVNMVSGRKVDETRTAIGAFAKAIPVKSQWVGHQPFDSLTEQVGEKLKEAERWHEYFTGASDVASGPDVRGELPIAFELVRLPSTIAAGSLTFRCRLLASRTGPSKLKVTAIRDQDRWMVRFEYDPHFYERDDVERHAASFVTFVADATARTRARIVDLEILDADERRRLLLSMNDTAAEYPRTCLHELFGQQVVRTPDRPALIFEGREWSYAELNARANQLAHALRRRGVGPSVRVALCVERSAEMVIGLLGIMKAGGAHVPLSPDHPQPRLRHQMTESEIAVVVTQETFLGQLPDASGIAVCLDRDADLLANEPVEDLRVSMSPTDLAYVLYTSGSTGTPKGVAVSHQSLVNYATSICRRFHLTAGEAAPLHFATVSTLTADLGNTAIFPALISGGCLHVIGYDTATDPKAFSQYVSRHPIDVLKIVPSHLRALIGSSSDASLLPRQYLVLGGEPLSWELADDVAERSPTCRIFNHYGPTETTVGSLMFEVAAATETHRRARTVPIGKPIANTQLYIVDEQLRPVPVGVAGELLVGGDGVAQGYLGRPELTAERFVPHPFSDDGEARVYRTGDLVRYLADGNVEFLGRADSQVKIRGFRVELGEIEAVLSAHHAIRESVVVARETGGDEKQLVAYIVPAGEDAPAADELRRVARERLPDYMVPAAYVVLRSLPLTRNGKVDRAALPSPDAQAEPETAYVAPRTALEQTIAELWAHMLKRERVGIQDNFFDLGGHSLLVTQVVSRLRSQLQVDVSLRTLFEHPTVAGVAAAIAQQPPSPADAAALDPLLAELEEMSDEDAERLLDGESRQRS